MPFTPSPSSVFPNHRYSKTSESHEAFPWQQPAPAPQHFYRGSARSSAPAPYEQKVLKTVPQELTVLEHKITSLQAATTAKVALAAAVDVAHASDADGQIWQGASYDSFAQYCGEASRVRSAGRLAFGNDRMKMDVHGESSGEGSWRY